MSNVNIVSSKLSDKNELNQKFIGSALGILKSEIVFVIDTSVSNIVNGEYFLPLPEQALVGKNLLDIRMQHEALGSNTALSIGLINFDKDNALKTDGKYVIDSSKITDAKFVASFVTTSAQDTSISKLKLSGSDYRFTDNDFIVIKNSGSASITSGKIRVHIALYSI